MYVYFSSKFYYTKYIKRVNYFTVFGGYLNEHELKRVLMLFLMRF